MMFGCMDLVQILQKILILKYPVAPAKREINARKLNNVGGKDKLNGYGNRNDIIKTGDVLKIYLNNEKLPLSKTKITNNRLKVCIIILQIMILKILHHH